MNRLSPTEMSITYELWGRTKDGLFSQLHGLYDAKLTSYATLTEAKRERALLVKWWSENGRTIPWQIIFLVRVETTGTVLYGE